MQIPPLIILTDKAENPETKYEMGLSDEVFLPRVNQDRIGETCNNGTIILSAIRILSFNNEQGSKSGTKDAITSQIYSLKNVRYANRWWNIIIRYLCSIPFAEGKIRLTRVWVFYKTDGFCLEIHTLAWADFLETLVVFDFRRLQQNFKDELQDVFGSARPSVDSFPSKRGFYCGSWWYTWKKTRVRWLCRGKTFSVNRAKLDSSPSF